MKENNLLMLHFLGGRIENNRIETDNIIDVFLSFNSYMTFVEEEGLRAKKELEFHYNWNWLMLVVEKIESLGFETILDNKNFYIRFAGGNTQAGIMYTNKIEAVYNSCVEFIKWYNK